uniref:Uncharacterized protein n=1 Tax=Arundo donax TaxID=35708 RepID=A0A0A9A5W9_ARUDO
MWPIDTIPKNMHMCRRPLLILPLLSFEQEMIYTSDKLGSRG